MLCFASGTPPAPALGRLRMRRKPKAPRTVRSIPFLWVKAERNERQDYQRPFSGFKHGLNFCLAPFPTLDVLVKDGSETHHHPSTVLILIYLLKIVLGCIQQCASNLPFKALD